MIALPTCKVEDFRYADLASLTRSRPVAAALENIRQEVLA